MSWFGRDGELSRRISGADPVLRGRHGHDGLGGRPDDALCRPRAAEPRRLCPRLLPAHATSARPRRASNISCSARSPAASCSTASRCSTASPARPCSPASRSALGDGAVDRRAVRHRLRARRPRLQDQRGAVPHVDARRLRRRADAGHRLLRQRAQGRGDGAAGPRRDRGDGPGDRRLAADRDLRGAGLDHPRRASPRSASPTSSACSPTARSTMSASR